MHTYKLTIAYDGTNFSGWQIQPNAVTIQELIETALKKFLRLKSLSLIGSGRTDAGVHARGQIAHFRVTEAIDVRRLLLALNGMLPSEIRVLRAEAAPLDFHARYSATGKEYHYNLFLDAVMDPFVARYTWHIKRPVDANLLRLTCSKFVGTHDFTAFSNEASKGAAAKNGVRTLFRIDPIPVPGGIRLEFEGNGFLYKMVRNLVGMLVAVAAGKRQLDEIDQIFQQKDRRLAALAAPAKGLTLMQVFYPN